MNKKIVAAVLTIAVAFLATAALANEGMAKGPRKDGAGFKQERMKRPQMSAEEKAQFDKMRKAESELRTELEKATPDKEKARALNKEIVELRAKASADRFAKMLNREKPKDCPKMSEAQKARIKKMHELSEAIREELGKEKVDKAKATALHNELIKLRKEAEMERFEFVLENPKKFSKGHRGHGEPGPKPECGF